MTDLNARLLAAHEAGDRQALVALYQEAARHASDLDATCFFLTHAYVFALELDHPDAPNLRAQLAAHGREPEG